MDAHFENQVIDELVAQGYSEDQVLDAIVELEDENNTLYLSGKGKSKKEVRKEKKEAKKAAKAEKKEAKKAAKTEKKEQKAAAKVAKKATANKVATVTKKDIQAVENSVADAVSSVKAKVAEIAANTAESNGLSDEAADEVVNKALEDAGIETEETVDTVVEEKKSKLPLILGIGGGVLAIIIIVVIILARRKK